MNTKILKVVTIIGIIVSIVIGVLVIDGLKEPLEVEKSEISSGPGNIITAIKNTDNTNLVEDAEADGITSVIVGHDSIEAKRSQVLGTEDISDKEKLLRNALSEEISAPRIIPRTTKGNKQVEFVFHKEPRVIIKLDGQEIEFETKSIDGKAVSPKKAKIFENREVTYEDIVKDIDLKYTVTNDLIAEEFIVKSKEAGLSLLGNFEQNIKTAGIKVVWYDSKTFGFYSEKEEGKEIFRFSQPFAKDAKGKVSNDLSFSLDKPFDEALGYRLTKSLGESAKKWLEDSERSYPVSIDPTVIVSGGIAETEVQYGGLQRKITAVGPADTAAASVKIDDAGDPGPIRGFGRQVVRTSGGTLYAFINDGAATCEMWKSSDGTSWAQVGASLTCDNDVAGRSEAAAIDSTGIIHVAYIELTTENRILYNTFNTGTDAFVTQEVALSGLGGTDYTATAIAVDSSDIPHVVGEDDLTNSKYTNRVGGSWKAAVTIESVAVEAISLAISEDNIPEISYINTTDADLTAAVGDANNAASFTLQDVDADVNNTAGSRGTSIAIDSSGNTWISYVDATTNYVTLVKHLDADAWTTWQTATTNSNVGDEPSIAINGISVYVFYDDENADTAYDLYTGAWAGETIMHTGTYQDVRAKWSQFNNNGGSTQIDFLFSDNVDIYWSKLTFGIADTSFYAFYNDAGVVSYKKSTDGGVSFGTAVTVSDGDTDNYNPSIGISGKIVHVFWVDDGAENIEGRRLNTSGDALGTMCSSMASQGTIGSTFVPTVAALSPSAAVVAYSDFSTDTEVDVFEITGLDGTCATPTDVNPGNIIFGSGITAEDRPVLVGINSTTADMIFQDGNLSYSRYNASSDEWTRNNLTIGSVTDNIYSVVSDGTTIWVLSISGTTATNFYSCCTDDWLETQLDADTGGANQDGISNIDIFCVSATDDCKLVYTDDIDTLAPRVIFVDCNNADCSSSTSVTIDADIDGGAGIDNLGANAAIYCTSGTECSIVYQDDIDTTTPKAIFVDCDGADNTNACSTIGTQQTNADFGAATSDSRFSIYCPTNDNCKFLYDNDTGAGVDFVDCADDACTNTTDTITEVIDFGTATTMPKNAIFCPSSNQCKVFAHDDDASSVVLVDCSTAGTAETCATPPTPDTIDAAVGGTDAGVPVAVSGTTSNTDYKLAYGDGADGDLTFIDCNAADCTTVDATTDIDSAGGAYSDPDVSLSMDCSLGLDDCKITYIGNTITAGQEELYFIDCDNAGCTSGSAIVMPGPRYSAAVSCPATGNCKFVYYEGTGDADVVFADCDVTNCFPSVTDLSDPWTGQTNITSVSLSLDTTNSRLYAHVIKDTSEQAWFKDTAKATISWRTEVSYGFTVGDLGHISGVEKGAGRNQIGVALRQGTNFEFALVTAQYVRIKGPTRAKGNMRIQYEE